MKTAPNSLTRPARQAPGGLTLEFENARTLQALHGGDESLLREMERELGLRIISRDGWIRFEGKEEAMQRAGRTFGQLESVVRSGGSIGRGDFLYALARSGESSASGLEDLHAGRIQCSGRKPPVVPKTTSQRDYLRAISEHELTFGLGPAGTGKTYLAVARAVEALRKGNASRILLTRPAVEAGEALGFLPGQLQEKILPYLRPLYDALHEMLEPEEIARALERNIIEIAPLAYMRGRTLNRSFIILDEAQNTTAEQMFMFLTRIGPGSRCVITGDTTQVDLPRNKPSGLAEALVALRGTEGIAFHHFGEEDVVRHPLVREIITAYRNHREKPAR